MKWTPLLHSWSNEIWIDFKIIDFSVTQLIHWLKLAHKWLSDIVNLCITFIWCRWNLLILFLQKSLSRFSISSILLPFVLDRCKSLIFLNLIIVNRIADFFVFHWEAHQGVAEHMMTRINFTFNIEKWIWVVAAWADFSVTLLIHNISIIKPTFFWKTAEFSIYYKIYFLLSQLFILQLSLRIRAVEISDFFQSWIGDVFNLLLM